MDGGVGLATWIRTTTAKLRRRYLYRINGSILSGLATVWIKKESKEKSVLRVELSVLFSEIQYKHRYSYTYEHSPL
jgi:hypothetical protein